MNKLKTLASAAAVALSLAAAAAPAHASVFAQFSPDTGASDYKWINSGASNSGTGGEFLSIVSNASTVAQGVATHFSFLDPALSALAFIPATFTIDATVAAGHPATLQASTGVWTQTNLNGSFSFVYTGATIANYLGSGINLVHNSNLLSGVFTDAWIQGAGGSGSTNLANMNGGTVTYASAYKSFANVLPGSEEFALNLLNVSPAFGANTNKALKNFTANGGGNFSAIAVPEPATWGLMIVGFGGVGAMVRNRRRHAIATA